MHVRVSGMTMVAAFTMTVALAAAPPAVAQAEKDWLTSLRASEARREERQRVGDILAALDIKPGARVADLGAGQGFFTVRLAKAVGPTGRVIAVEANAKTLDKLRERITREGLTNVDVLEGTQQDTHLMTRSLDAVLIVNAYHEMPEYRTILHQIREALRPDAPLVIVEPLDTLLRQQTRAEQAKQHYIASSFVMHELREAGFAIAALQDPFIRRGSVDEEWLVVARPLVDLTRRPSPETTAATATAQPRPTMVDASIANRLSPKQRIYMDEFKALYDKSDVLVLDVRDRGMYRDGHIPGALLIPEDQFEQHLDALRAERRLIVAYCSCPAEETSLHAVQKLATLGITNARALVGGYRLWAGEKNPVATGEQSCDGPQCPLKKPAAATSSARR